MAAETCSYADTERLFSSLCDRAITREMNVRPFHPQPTGGWKRKYRMLKVRHMRAKATLTCAEVIPTKDWGQRGGIGRRYKPQSGD